METKNKWPEYMHRVKLNGKTKDGSKIQADANLHYIEGNDSPYFGVTASGAGFGGCCHELILEAFPELAPIVAIHLSDMDGSPSHGVANGLYWIKEGKADTLSSHLRITLEEAEKIINEYRDIFSNSTEEKLSELKTYLEAQEDQEEPNQAQTKELELLKALKVNADLIATNQIKAMTPRWKKEAEEAIKLLESLKPKREPLDFHDQQAKDFLRDTDTVHSIQFLRCEPQKHDPQLINDIYEVILCRGEESYTFDFHNSHNDSGQFLIKFQTRKETQKEESIKFATREEAEKMLKNCFGLHQKSTGKKEDYIRRLINKYHNGSFIGPKPKDWIQENKGQKEPSLYSILACLQKYDAGSFQDFVAGFGYELDSTNYGETMKTYQAVKSQFSGLSRLYSEDELELMAEIQ